MSHETHSKALPNWFMILAFTIIFILLWAFGDVFTAIGGTIIEILVFSIGYNRVNGDAH
jgi:hypothetical protein